ncbi:hypothetical protein J6590_020650 [Homalodisca vitripennis]|nr:hypothetical protein J6590_020650 [Homalodisca vitripennis]
MSAEHFLCGGERLLFGWCGRLDKRSWSDGGGSVPPFLFSELLFSPELEILRIATLAASFLCFTVCVENCVMSCQQLWDREKILTLIKLYEQHSLLWNPREESYKTKNKRNYSLKVIATEIKVRHPSKVGEEAAICQVRSQVLTAIFVSSSQ